MSDRNLNVNGDPIPDEVANTLHQRDEQWGDTYKRVAKMFNIVTGTKLITGDFITVMLCLKLLRWQHSGYRDIDSLVDIIGYARLGMTYSKSKDDTAPSERKRKNDGEQLMETMLFNEFYRKSACRPRPDKP